MVDFKIDFVVTWVDGSDKEWLKKKEKYSEKKVNDQNRFRDYGLLENFFERVWKYAPWVNNVFLVTDNQAPEWAKKDDRIITVNHTDYIPKEYLPTFNSNVIEMNLWRIDELQEHFVIFNDDFFITKDVSPEDFFSIEGLPVLNGTQNPVSPQDELSKTSFNNMVYVNQKFQKKEVLKKNFSKYYTLKYGFSGLLRSVLLFPYSKWLGFYEDHLPYPNLKSWFIKINQEDPEVYVSFSNNKFRKSNDYSIWLLKNLYIAAGEFSPRSHKFGTVLNIEKKKDLDTLGALINKYKVVVINDDFKEDAKLIVDRIVQTMKEGF